MALAAAVLVSAHAGLATERCETKPVALWERMGGATAGGIGGAIGGVAFGPVVGGTTGLLIGALTGAIMVPIAIAENPVREGDPTWNIIARVLYAIAGVAMLSGIGWFVGMPLGMALVGVGGATYGAYLGWSEGLRALTSVDEQSRDGCVVRHGRNGSHTSPS